MATLNSPGVSVSIIDESIYTPAGGGTIPLIVTASRQNKINPSGSLAAGTLPSAGGNLTLVTGKTNLVSLFGNPVFKTVNGTVLHGYETNEYGLHTAYQALGIANQAYILNADIDLAQLEGSATEPTQPVANGTHWLDLSDISFGLFMWNTTTSAWEEQTVHILNEGPNSTNVQPISTLIAPPRDTYGSDGDFAVVTSITPMVIYQKSGGTWFMLGESAYPHDFQFAPHTKVPTTRADGTPLQDGDTYVKTTVPNGGAYFDVSSYNSTSGQFVQKEVPFYVLDDSATSYFSGLNELTEGVLFAQIDNDGPLNNDFSVNNAFPKSSGGVAVFTIKRFNGNTSVSATSSQSITQIPLATYATSKVIINGVTVTFDSSTSADNTNVTASDMVKALQSNTSLQALGLRFALVSTDKITITSTKNTDITVQNVGVANTDWTPNTMTDVASVMGFAYSVTAGEHHFTASNWEDLVYTADYTEPTQEAAIGTLWYSTSLRAEFLQSYYNATDNKVEWKTYAWTEDNGQNGLSHKATIAPSAPSSPSDGDIWVDSSDVENYPIINKYSASASAWVTLDNTDQTTTNGVVFGNYAYQAPFDSTGTARPASDVSTLAPNPDLYPEGILLFNMDYSTYNVKEYQGNGVWASVSGNKPDGSPYMGRKAQRAMVVKAMKEAVVTSKEARSKDKYFNLLVAPGYPELISDLDSLNTDRKLTSFVIGSSPMRLQPVGNVVQNWATNANGALVDGEDGLVTFSNMSAVWAFAGLQSDTAGNTVAVPSDTMATQVILQNDQMAYPWYAPAGDTRGVVPGTTAIGYVTNNYEFALAHYDDGLVDTLYENKINPILNYANEAIKVYGQKTLATVTSSLDRINVARLTVYLRYMLDKIVRPYIFEQNDSQTRQAAQNTVEKFLADILQKRGITDFVVVCDTSNNTPSRIDANQLWIDVALVPTKSTEFIFIPVRLEQTGAL